MVKLSCVRNEFNMEIILNKKIVVRVAYYIKFPFVGA